jgi:hypothetical protein
MTEWRHGGSLGTRTVEPLLSCREAVAFSAILGVCRGYGIRNKVYIQPDHDRVGRCIDLLRYGQTNELFRVTATDAR